MTVHISGNILTHLAPAANNRGENEGNLTTLQKLLWEEQVHTTVSAEAIRWAVRYAWQERALEVRRRWDDDTEDYDHVLKDAFDATRFIDDDLMGYMAAEGAKAEGGKGQTTKRRGVLEVSRAVSLTPYAGDITFNARAGKKENTSLYGTEVHATRYQYGFAMTPSRMKDPKRVEPALRALLSLGEVAGNQSRFLYDFSPESVVIRVSHDPSPRILYCFDAQGEQGLGAGKLLRAVQSGDVPAEELIVGGLIAHTKHGEALRKAGVTVLEGVREVADRALRLIDEVAS